MTNRHENEPYSPTPELHFNSRLEALRDAMRRRIAYYVDDSVSYEKGEVSLIMDVLEQQKLTLYDLTNEEIKELDTLEKELIADNLRIDTIMKTPKEETL